MAGSSVPSIELSSVLTDATETETESWIAGIENEESIQGMYVVMYSHTRTQIQTYIYEQLTYMDA